MTVCITVLASLVALAAAVRSTWSPCGLSMLSTITPLGERAKGHAYPATAGWFVLGSTIGGVALGALTALMAGGVRSLQASSTALGTAALCAAVVAAGSDAGVFGFRIPIHRRQVNERWLDQYRPWVYAGGFGWQIGTGLFTYITTAAVYLMIVLAALTADPVTAFVLGTCFGLLRGLAVLLTRHLTTPAALLTFHRRFAAAGPWVGRAVTAAEVAASAVLVVLLWSPVALGVVGAAACLATFRFVHARWREAHRPAGHPVAGDRPLPAGAPVPAGADRR
jgi:MFS family permease